MKQTFDLLASAATIEQIRECIARFYCGTSTTLIPIGNDDWRLVRTSDGKALAGVAVRRRRRRFQFVMTSPA